MFYISEIQTVPPKTMLTQLQKATYDFLDTANIPFERVETDEAISMEDCIAINEKLNMKMVKTLFLCNRKQTDFYLFVTSGNKHFSSKDFSAAIEISRVSFAPQELMLQMLDTKPGAATIFSMLLKSAENVTAVLDKDIIKEEYYGCSDGTTTNYLKIKTEYVTEHILPRCARPYRIAEV